MIEQIRGLLDYNASTFIEAFGGSASLTLNSAPHDKEVYIDMSIALCSFWASMADKDAAYELIRRLYDTDYDKESFDVFRNTIDAAETSGKQLAELSDDEVLELAAACFVTFSHSRDGAGLRYREGRDKRHTAYLRSVDRLTDVADRFCGVKVEHANTLDILSGDRFNNPDVCLYMDPVYLSAKNKKHTHNYSLYRYHFTYDEHLAMLERIREMSARIILSGYVDDDHTYDQFLVSGEGWDDGAGSFKPWARYEVEAVSSVAQGDKARTEVLWCNYA